MLTRLMSKKAPNSYKHSMTLEDHERLAVLLRKCRASWVLSYDDHPVVRDLYSWAQVEPVRITYTTAVRRKNSNDVGIPGQRKNSEVIIFPREAGVSKGA